MSDNQHLMTTYAPMDVTFDHGEGAVLWDTEGKQYLDALAGIAVCGLGHAHPAVTAAITEQATKLVHTSNLYQIQNQQRLADELCRLSGLDRVFFANSGAEANEAAIKIARMYGNNKGVSSPGIIVMENSFHGRTMATLSATGNRHVQAGFEPLVQGFIRAPFNNIDAIENIAANSSNVVAVMVEPIQGEAGINVPATDYLNRLRKICDDNNWLLMLDEIQTGMGRTGQWFAFQHNDLLPDIVTLAKALGNGVPIGACIANSKAAEVMKPGSHGSTFGGNPLACAAGLAVIKTIAQEKLVERAATIGTRLSDKLHAALDNVDGVKEIRGLGLMIGIQLDKPCKPLVSEALRQGLLISVQSDYVIRLLPPLTISEQQIETLTGTLSTLVRSFLQQEAA
ncbi:MAG: acetylornithine transaminase [Gammaproteobacteria bacterium]|nr:acetylornithine transaminase [Gammaproteobacteria bacterium]NNJ95607.1 acetylornithine transaminase [Gammaproteobacteria bacterium]